MLIMDAPSTLARLSISLPAELMIQLDAMVAERGLPSRSQMIAELIRHELAEHSGVVCSRERLLEEVWGYVWAGDTRLVDMHVRRLRAKVGAEVIETVRGAGYKLVKR